MAKSRGQVFRRILLVSKTKEFTINNCGVEGQPCRYFTRKEDLRKIGLDSYQNLYMYKAISGEVKQEVLEGLPTTFTGDMNATLSRTITEKELSTAILSMAKGKAPGHDDIPIEFFQHYWPTISKDFLRMVFQSMKEGAFHEGMTIGLINLIPKEGDSKDLDYSRPITLLAASYKIFAKTLQLRL